MRSREITPELREMAELQHAELFGRLHACEILEDGLEQIADPHVLYGWSMLTQEVLIRLGEASLKLLHILQFGTNPPAVIVWRIYGQPCPKRFRTRSTRKDAN